MEVTWVFEVIRWYVSTVELPLPATSPQLPLFLALRTVHTLTFVFPKTSLKRQRSLKGVPNCQNRDLKQLLWRRQRQRQNTIGFMTKTTALHVHHAVWYISLTSTVRLQRQTSQSDVLQRTWTYDKNFPFFIWTWIKPLRINSSKSSLQLTNWAVPIRRDKVWKDANSFLQWCFHCRRCRSSCLKSLLTSRQLPVFSVTGEKLKNGHEFWFARCVDD